MSSVSAPTFGDVADCVQKSFTLDAPLSQMAYDAGAGPELNQISIYPFAEAQLFQKKGLPAPGKTGVNIIYKASNGVEVSSRITANEPFLQKSVLPLVHYDFQRVPGREEMIEFNSAEAALAYKMAHSIFQYRCQVRVLDRFASSAEVSGFITPSLCAGCTMEYEPFRAGVKRFTAAASYPLNQWCPCFKNGSVVVGRFDAKEGPSLHMRIPIPSICPCASSYDGIILAESHRLVAGIHTATCCLMDKVAMFTTIAKTPLLSFLATKTVSKNVKVSMSTQMELSKNFFNAPQVGIRITN